MPPGTTSPSWPTALLSGPGRLRLMRATLEGDMRGGDLAGSVGQSDSSVWLDVALNHVGHSTAVGPEHQ